MDAYLSREAFQTLQVLSLLPPHTVPDGLLIGHRRGHRYFVERVLPTQKGFFPSVEKYFTINKLCSHKILGFFSYLPEEKRIKKIFAPFAFGKLLLKIRSEGRDNMTIEPFVIDYEKEFHLSSIPLRLSK